MRILAVCLVALLCGAGCDVRVDDDGVSLGVSAGRAEDEWVRTYVLPPSGRVEIGSTNGPIEVTASPGESVDVHVYREARASSDEAARELLDTIEIGEDAGEDRVSIEVRSGAPAGRGPGRHERLSARIRLRVPAGLTTAFRTQNGQVRLENVDGRMTVVVSNGGIVGSGLAGSIDASVANGGVQLSFVSISHPSQVTAVNGGIRVELPEDLQATIAASAINGGVRVDEAFAPSGRSTGPSGAPGGVTATLNGGGPLITLRATNGGVRVTTPGSGPSIGRPR